MIDCSNSDLIEKFTNEKTILEKRILQLENELNEVTDEHLHVESKIHEKSNQRDQV